MLIIAYIPCGSEEEAEKIGESLVKKRLAACANIIESKSIYEWDKKLEKTNEWVVLAKTVPERFKELEGSVKGMHSYETPCIICIPVLHANEDYLEWAEKQIKDG